MKNAVNVIDFVAGEPEMVRLLRAVEAQKLPDCWIGAGFLRNAVWDALHGRPRSTLSGDIDVAARRIGATLVERGIVPPGSAVVLVSMTPELGPGPSNFLKLERV